MKILAIIGTYRKGGIIDTAVEEVLAGAREQGAETDKIYLTDRHVEFCTNCRTCTQKPGPEPGLCVIDDDMKTMLGDISGADAFVLASPINMGTVTAVMKRFIERLVCFAYWPWETVVPKYRLDRIPKRAVLVSSSAAPARMSRMMAGMPKVLKEAARLMGAQPIGTLFIGKAAMRENQDVGQRDRKNARVLGKKLAASRT